MNTRRSRPLTVNFDPFKAFEQAERFYGTIEQLHRTSLPQRFEVIGVPVCVLSAFASELFFKCLVAIETGSATKEHFLDNLLNQLSAKTQAIIEKHWDQRRAERKKILDDLDRNSGKAWPRDLRANLEAGRDGFSLLRYFYEDKTGPFNFNLGDLPIVLREAVKELRPDWFPGPAENKPHAIFVEGKAGPHNAGVSFGAVVDNKSTAFQWSVRWAADIHYPRTPKGDE
jgi:hypothetical protein